MHPEEEAAVHLAKNQFHHFIPYCFYTINPPPSVFTGNWHLDYLAYTLSRTLPAPFNPTPDHRIHRLIINVPPRTLKTEMTAVALPAFILGHMPHERIIGASYSGRLAEDANSKTRDITRQLWYQQMFPDFEVDSTGSVTGIKNKDTGVHFETTKKGHRFATSVGGTVTGIGANYIIADDLLNPMEASSTLQRERCNDWFDETLVQRLNDPVNGVIIMIMQRLHENDLTGHLLKKNKELPPDRRWHHACFPAICQEPKTYEYYGKTKHWEKGELLFPARLSAETLAIKQIEAGVYGYVGQYLQQPAPKGGSIVQLAWYQRYEQLPERSKVKRVIQSWDTAQKAQAGNDPSVCETYFEMDNGYYLVDVFRKKMEYPELKDEVIRNENKWKPNAILIEDKSTGSSLLQDFTTGDQKIHKFPVIKIAVNRNSGDKVARMSAQSSVIEAGQVWLPMYAHWLADFELEISMFPASTNDDQVDSHSQALKWMRETNYVQYRVTST